MSQRQSSLSFEPIADRYDATRGGERRGRRTAANLAPLLDPAAPVMEVGVGTGIVALALRQLGYTVVGVDLSPAMAQRARRRLGPVVAVADAAQLPVADAAIQQAVSVWLLHLVADRTVVLAEVARALRPGGRYLVIPTQVRVPPQDEVERLLFDMRNQLDPTGGWRDDERQLLDAAQLAGFTMVDRRHASLGEVPQSPAEIADDIEARTWSHLWDLTHDQWRTVVAPTVAALRALPDAHVQRRYDIPQRIIVLQRG
ncbi:MAG TPA: class I SAM-dependent methyltransferase [Actinomycetota bacterium]|nr:class I SAM-dependent methyltransferase [Actinomycetota bacterium]